MSPKALRNAMIWITLVMLTACASDVSVGTSFDPLERFPATALWRWDEIRNVLPTDDRITALDLGPAVEGAIAAEFSARGYRERVSEAARYTLSYQLNVTSRIRPEGSFAVGSLSLLLSDAESGRRVWSGFAQTEVDMEKTDRERRERLREIVGEMLADFPPGSDG